MEDRLSLDQIAIGGLVRSSYSSLIPMGIDTVARATYGEPLLDFRTGPRQ